MAPKSRLIVYSVRPDNKEVLVDATDFKVDGLFRNNVSFYSNLRVINHVPQVSLSIDRVSAEPGQSVKFKVHIRYSTYKYELNKIYY